jgi:hypothetical protein
MSTLENADTNNARVKSGPISNRPRKKASRSQLRPLSENIEKKVSNNLAIDTLVFKDDGKASYTQNPRILGVKYCRHCKAWHDRLSLETGLRFCAFCYTTHHSKACRSGLGQKCPDPSIDPIHDFLSDECARNQKFDLAFCSECNCFHSKQGWSICLEANRPKPTWTQSRQTIWKLRWEACTLEGNSTLRRERSLFDMSERSMITPYEYPFSNGKFVHHCNL